MIKALTLIKYDRLSFADDKQVSGSNVENCW